MVCSIGSGKMTALARLLDAGRISQTVTEEVGHHKLAAQYIRRELREADEANLLDEEDMHIFGLRPMTDPLDLVCCNACKKPIKASRYTAHAELCRSLSSAGEINLELDGPSVNKKPPRKERKKLLTAQNKKTTTVGEPRKFEFVDSDAIAASEAHVGNMLLNSTHQMNGSRVSPYNMDCSEGVTKHSSKPLKRLVQKANQFNSILNSLIQTNTEQPAALTAAENPSDPGIKNLCKTAAKVLPYVPAPLATKIYYTQGNHHLRKAICHMFEESSKESNSEVSNVEALQVNVVPTQTSSPCNVFHEQVVNQQRDDHLSHLAQSPDQILAASSDFYVGKSGGFAPSMNTATQLTVNSTLGPHYKSNSYPFAAKAGNPLGTVQQDSGSVPVV